MFEGKVAAVTGATGGVGPAVVEMLVGGGATVVALARKETELVALQRERGVPDARWFGQGADLTNAVAAEQAIAAVIARFGAVDILVCLAGGWRGGTLVMETEASTLEWLFRVNLLTVFNVCRAALPHMVRRRWGRIVTIGARSAVDGQARSGAYAASKAAVIALTKSIAVEAKGAGVTANALLPSTIDTPANRAAMPAADHSRWVTPEQIASAVRYLCSEESAAVSGAAVPIYGGA